MARSSPFDKRVDAEREVRYGTDASRRREADNFSGNEDLDPALATRASRREADVFTNDADLEPALSSRASPSASAALDEICLQDRGLTAVPSRLGEDRPGRVRPRKIDLSDNMIKSLSGLPQSVVQLKAANNSLRDWEGINTLPRLQRLDLSYNQIHQMGPFGICCAIRVLRLKGNAIGTLAGIEGAARTLIELDVSDNVLRCVDDIQPLTGCTRLTSVRQAGIAAHSNTRRVAAAEGLLVLCTANRSSWMATRCSRTSFVPQNRVLTVAFWLGFQRDAPWWTTQPCRVVRCSPLHGHLTGQTQGRLCRATPSAGVSRQHLAAIPLLRRRQHVEVRRGQGVLAR
jgi:hypothetical protein